MPILNNGTLLEYVVLVEACQQACASVSSGLPVEFANSFALPPLTPWIPHPIDYGFSQARFTALNPLSTTDRLPLASLIPTSSPFAS
jgi:hypothetical protein